MKFLLTIYGNEDVWGALADDDRAALIAATDQHNRELFDSGELLFACGTSDPATTRLVTRPEGSAAPVVTDGPYIETKEHVGSFYIIDCADEARAIEIAAAMPSATFRQIEVQAILHGGSADDF